MTDFYRNKLKHAGWTWRERKRLPNIFVPTRRKDRQSGRADKHSAKKLERQDIEEQEREHNPEEEAAMLDLFNCEVNGIRDCKKGKP